MKRSYNLIDPHVVPCRPAKSYMATTSPSSASSTPERSKKMLSQPSPVDRLVAAGFNRAEAERTLRFTSGDVDVARGMLEKLRKSQFKRSATANFAPSLADQRAQLRSTPSKTWQPPKKVEVEQGPESWSMSLRPTRRDDEVPTSAPSLAPPEAPLEKRLVAPGPSPPKTTSAEVPPPEPPAAPLPPRRYPAAASSAAAASSSSSSGGVEREFHLSGWSNSSKTFKQIVDCKSSSPLVADLPMELGVTYVKKEEMDGMKGLVKFEAAPTGDEGRLKALMLFYNQHVRVGKMELGKDGADGVLFFAGTSASTPIADGTSTPNAVVPSLCCIVFSVWLQVLLSLDPQRIESG